MLEANVAALERLPETDPVGPTFAELGGGCKITCGNTCLIITCLIVTLAEEE